MVWHMTAAQARAFDKMREGIWLTPYDLGESIGTLKVLVKHGLVIHQVNRLGDMFSPRTANAYMKCGEEKKL